MLGCGERQLRELINAGKLRSYKRGRARRILVESIRDFVAGEAAAAQSSAV